MVISEEELKKIIETDYSLEKISSICTDGKNLLTRIPKDVVDLLKIKKGYQIRWSVKPDTKELTTEIIKNG